MPRPAQDPPFVVEFLDESLHMLDSLLDRIHILLSRRQLLLGGLNLKVKVQQLPLSVLSIGLLHNEFLGRGHVAFDAGELARRLCDGCEVEL